MPALQELATLDAARLPGAAELPYDDGEPMETGRNLAQMVLLMHSLETAWKDRQDFFVGGNMFVYYSPEQIRKNNLRGPDVRYYFFDCHGPRLEGFALESSTKRYRPLRPALNGDLPCEPLGLSLGVRRSRYHVIEADWLRWIGPTGLVLPTPEEEAEMERQRADRERWQADVERRRAESALRTAEAEKTRADAEKKRADELEERLAALERRAEADARGNS